jgi:hypothetical protein
MRERYTEEQIIKAPREQASERNAKDIIREMGITEQTFYRRAT